MKYWSLVFVFVICFTSCKSTKSIKATDSNKTVVFSSKKTAPKLERIITKANSYKGTRYKYGGTTRKGMDCSGLVYVAFKSERIVLPRVSKDMAKKGKRIKPLNIRKGDLLFFKTSKNKRTINHVGLVVFADKNTIRFIHSSSSKGVITSSLSESYWKNSFVQARRLL